ncbi:adenylate kinase [Salinicola corii]|uniref:Adenylate kinase n=1 Tax=Salinicola corii TaxID=2606937 RepID=A0A640WGU3_9GAMM|nr:adenylate kinase [Salinicola corii]KAA0019621.1 adenylate kinase [Salinicola corii]
MKINVVGTSGSGKSTLARQLASVLEIPHIQLDQLYWQAGWQGTPDDEFFARLRRAMAASPDGWVIDGNFDRTRHIKWHEADIVIWLDLGFWRVMSQSVRRAIARIVTREELWPGTGNRESFRQTFLSRRSILLWSQGTWRQNRRRYLEAMIDPTYRHIRFVRLTHQAEVDTLVRRLPLL